MTKRVYPKRVYEGEALLEKREKAREYARKKYADLEWRKQHLARCTELRKEKQQDPVAKAKDFEKRKARRSTPEYKAKHNADEKARYKTPRVRALKTEYRNTVLKNNVPYKERQKKKQQERRPEINARTRQRMVEDPEFKQRRLRSEMLKTLKTYGLSEEEYQQMQEEQQNVCAICCAPPDKKKLHIDHCHTTGKVRALLCQNCNIGLGHFKDSKQLLSQAISYLLSHEDIEK